MVVGPINGFHVGRITEILDAHKVVYSLLQDPSAHEDIQKAQLDKPPGRESAIYRSSGSHIYIDMPEENLSLISSELEKMGIVYSDQSDVEKSLEEVEYHCLECEHTSTEPGKCPEHQKELLEYSDWVKTRASQESSSMRGVGIVIVLIAAAIYIYLKFSKS